MAATRRVQLLPSLLLAVGLLIATAVSVAASGWLSLAGPFILAVALLVADVGVSRLEGQPAVPTGAAVLAAGAMLLAFALVGSADPAQIAPAIPVIGTCAVAVVALRAESAACRRCEGT